VIFSAPASFKKAQVEKVYGALKRKCKTCDVNMMTTSSKGSRSPRRRTLKDSLVEAARTYLMHLEEEKISKMFRKSFADLKHYLQYRKV
jgi:DNA-binding protein Fis